MLAYQTHRNLPTKNHLKWYGKKEPALADSGGGGKKHFSFFISTSF